MVPMFALVSVYATQVIGLCNFYMFFSSTKANNYAYIELWPWLVLAFASFFVLHWFLKTPRALPQVITATALCCVVTLAVMSLWFIHVSTSMGWIFAWGMLASSIIQACLLHLNGCSPHSVLLCCELPVIGILFLLWMHEGTVYYLPGYYLVCTLVALLASFLSLGLMKMQSPTGQNDGNRPAATATAMACFVAMGALACGFVSFASATASSAVSNVSTLINWLWDSILTAINNFFIWLASLFPVSSEAVEWEMEATQVNPEDYEEITALDPSIIMALGALTIIAIVVWLMWLVFKFRKFKLHRIEVQARYRRPQKAKKTVSIWARFKAFCKAIVSRIAFSIRLFCKRNTPQGAVIVLSKLGRYRGYGRHHTESYHSYLTRLQTICHDPRLQTLSTALDGTLYGADTTACSLTPKDYRQLRKAVRALEKTKKAKKPADS